MYNTTANTTPLPDGRSRLIAHFPNSPEDTHYRATSKVLYTERSTQHSNQVNTSEYNTVQVQNFIGFKFQVFLLKHLYYQIF